MPHLLIKLLLLLLFAAVVAATQPIICCFDQVQGQVTTSPTKNHCHRQKRIIGKRISEEVFAMPHLLIKLLLLLLFAAIEATTQPVICCIEQEQGQVTTSLTKNNCYRQQRILEKEFLK
jgi:hypothetical protein